MMRTLTLFSIAWTVLTPLATLVLALLSERGEDPRFEGDKLIYRS